MATLHPYFQNGNESGPFVRRSFAELELISRWEGWEWFGGCSFAGKPPCVGQAINRGINFFQLVARRCEIPFPRLVWVLRVEHGEQGGRIHLHYLLGMSGLPLTPSGQWLLKRCWENGIKGAGLADVKVFNRSLRNVEYVTKTLGMSEQAPGASLYELDKFGHAQIPPMLSHSLLKILSGRLDSHAVRRVGQTRPGAQTKVETRSGTKQELHDPRTRQSPGAGSADGKGGKAGFQPF